MVRADPGIQAHYALLLFHEPAVKNNPRCWNPHFLLCGYGRVEPYEPHGVCLIEFGDGFS